MEQLTQIETNKISKVRYLLAAFFDIFICLSFLILINILSVAMTGVITMSDLRLAVKLMLSVAVAILYLFKDVIFDGNSPGKHLLGLKLVSLNGKGSGQFVMRNIFGFIALLLLSFPHSHFSFAAIVILLYAVANIIAVCVMSDRKLEDLIFNTRVVEDPDNNMWQRVSSREKTLYCIITMLLLGYLIYLATVNSYNSLSHSAIFYLSFRVITSTLPFVALAIIVKKMVKSPVLRILLYAVIAYNIISQLWVIYYSSLIFHFES